MFDGLLGRKFSSKCKSLIKTTKARMENIKKKRNAVKKYLEKDIADLLKEGLDVNAYGRAEGFLVEMNMSSCYEMIEQFYASVSNQLSIMDKQKECPEECREGVASLMYAAARFSDLPEIRDLRNMFCQRYGKSVESFVSKVFVEKLKAKPPTKETKLRLLQDIAQGSSIEWNPKALEQKLYSPPRQEEDSSKKEYIETKYVASNREEDMVRSHEKPVPLISKDNLKNSPISTLDISVEEEDAEIINKPAIISKFMPPPYLRPKASQPHDDYDGNGKTPKSGEKNLLSEANEKPKPRSVRSRNLKPPPGRENAASNSLPVKTLSFETDKIKVSEIGTGTGTGMINHGRTRSLPPDPTAHVHPKLPDYDDLAARIAALSAR